MPQTPSTRWCPTPEHLMILEEMYMSGIRTPNASQIQHITAHLSYYGKIEGKNVFYWFQNHKARDRQKMRRRLSRHQQLLQQHHNGQIITNPHQIFQMEISHSPVLHHRHFPYYQDRQYHPQLDLQQAARYNHENKSVMNGAYACKLDAFGKEVEEQELEEDEEEEMERSSMASTRTSTSTISGNEWTALIEMGSNAEPPCFRQPKTLDLFPTYSTGLRDRSDLTCTSKSSTSTTN